MCETSAPQNEGAQESFPPSLSAGHLTMGVAITEEHGQPIVCNSEQLTKSHSSII